jgi:hypothetical protein
MAARNEGLVMSENSDEKLWRDLCAADNTYHEARMRLLTNASDLDGIIRAALNSPAERGPALRILNILPEQQIRRHLAQLAQLASVGHSDIELVRSVISRIDRDWLTQNIDGYVTPLLKTGNEEEFRRIAELYKLLDQELLKAHLARCAVHANEEVREIASDFADETVG